MFQVLNKDKRNVYTALAIVKSEQYEWSLSNEVKITDFDNTVIAAMCSSRDE